MKLIVYILRLLICMPMLMENKYGDLDWPGLFIKNFNHGEQRERGGKMINRN